jgi:hypothetical protein
MRLLLAAVAAALLRCLEAEAPLPVCDSDGCELRLADRLGRVNAAGRVLLPNVGTAVMGLSRPPWRVPHIRVYAVLFPHAAVADSCACATVRRNDSFKGLRVL